MSTAHTVHIAGAGRGRTILKATGAAGEVLALGDYAASTLSGVTIVINSRWETGLGLVAAAADGIGADNDPATAASGTVEPGGPGRRRHPRQRADRRHGLDQRGGRVHRTRRYVRTRP